MSPTSWAISHEDSAGFITTDGTQQGVTTAQTEDELLESDPTWTAARLGRRGTPTSNVGWTMGEDAPLPPGPGGTDRVPLVTIARAWTRLGCTGFGGPPTHIMLLRRLCVTERGWMDAHEFEEGIAVTNLLPGPASTQLAIFCAYRLRGAIGGIVGGVCFIVPGLVLILGLSAVVLAEHPPHWILGAAAGAGAAELTRNAVQIPSETRLVFQLRAPAQ